MINGILFRARTGVPWRDLPERFGCWKTVYERHRGWSADGTWDRILQAVHTQADAEGRIDWSMVSVDSTSCRAHQHAAGAPCKAPRIPKRRSIPSQHRPDEGLGHCRGGLTCEVHVAEEGGCRPLALLITPDRWGDSPRWYPSWNASGSSAGGRPAGFDKQLYKRRNEVERTINRLKHSRAVATRDDKPA